MPPPVASKVRRSRQPMKEAAVSEPPTPETPGSDPEEPLGDGPQEAPGAEPEPEAEAPVAKEPTPFTQQLGRVFIVLLAVLFGIFAVANSQPVDFSWVFGETRVREDPAGEGEIGGVPLIVLLLITFALGMLIGAFVSWQVTRSRRRRES